MSSEKQEKCGKQAWISSLRSIRNFKVFPRTKNSDSPGNCNGRLYRFRATSPKEQKNSQEGAVRSEQGVPVDEKPHRRLKVWQASMDFVTELYRELQRFPVHEKFGLSAQLQRAAVSIPSNIAEGAARKSTRELLQFLYIARGSLSELDTQLEICHRVGYFEKPAFERIVGKLEAISKMLNGLIVSLEKQS